MQKKLIEYSFLITIFCFPLYLVRFSLFSIPLNILEIMAIFSIFLFALYKGFYFNKGALLNVGFMKIGILILLLGTFLSLLHENNFSLRGLSIIKSWFIVPILFSYCAGSFFYSHSSIKKIFISLYLSCFVVSLVAIIYKIAGIETYDGRLAAFYESPNQLSMFVVFGIFLFPYLYNHCKKTSSKLLLYFSLFSILITLYFTLSYSLWLSAIISFFLIFIFKSNIITNKKYYLIIFVIFVLFFSLQFSSDKLLNSLDSRSSFSSRIMVWESTIMIIKDNPIFGIGAGNFQNTYLLYQKYFTPYLEWAVPHPHNIYLAFWLQAGILGLFSFIYIVINFIVLWIKNKNTTLSMVFLGFIFYILIHGLVETTFWKNDLSYIFWLLIIVGSNKIYHKN